MNKQQMLLLAIVIWELLWKGPALWKAAQRKEKNWFIFMLILNTVGVLPMVYFLIKKYKKTKTNKNDSIVETKIVDIDEIKQ